MAQLKKYGFNAEVIEVKARKTASGDKEVRITLVTDESKALELQQAISNYAVSVKMEEIPE